MTLTEEEVELRIREAIAPLRGQRITKENLTQLLQSVTTQIYRELPPPERSPEDISIDENGKVTIPLGPYLSQLLREKLFSEFDRLVPDGETLYNPPVSDND